MAQIDGLVQDYSIKLTRGAFEKANELLNQKTVKFLYFIKIASFSVCVRYFV